MSELVRFIRRRPCIKTTVIRCAYCGAEKTVRVADVNRGWGRYCGKSCAAKDREQSA
jgi:hypothetical protein